MNHSFNLRRIAEIAMPKNSKKSAGNFYNRLTTVFKGAYGEMTEEEMLAVQAAMKEEWRLANEHLRLMIKTRRAVDKKQKQLAAA